MPNRDDRLGRRVSASKDKGTRAETAVVRWFRENGFGPGVERRALSGVADRGDVAGILGIVVEVKDRARYAIGEWLRETQTEAAAADADHAVLVVKPVGVGETRVGEWWAISPLYDFARLLRQAGYGDFLAPGVPEFQCPSCGAVTRGRMAEGETVLDPSGE